MDGWMDKHNNSKGRPGTVTISVAHSYTGLTVKLWRSLLSELCEHCNNELCHTQYFEHRKRYFKNGVWEKKSQSTMAGWRLALSSPSTPLHGRDQPLSASPQTGENKLRVAISGLSRQLTLLAADVNEQFTVVKSRLLSTEGRLAALESRKCVEETNSKKKRLVHNPKSAVRICSVIDGLAKSILKANLFFK